MDKLRERLKGNTPWVLSALTTGNNKIYFATSARGDGNIFDSGMEIDDRVKKALEKCGKEHRNKARCGEIMVMAYWYRKNAGKRLRDAKSKMIVSVDRKGIFDPCWVDREKGGRGDYGCKDFLEKMGFKEDEVIRKPKTDDPCGVAKRSIGGKAYNNKACATKSEAKSATPGKQAPKKPSTARKHRRSMHSLVELKGGALKGYFST